MTPAETADRLAQAWNLRLGQVLPGATCSLVLEAASPEHGDCVLKVPEAWAEECASWPTALAFSACGGVAVHRHDPATGALLMPRLRPGTTLSDSDLDDLTCVEIAAQCMVALRDAPHAEAMSATAFMSEIHDGDPAHPMVRRAWEVLDDLEANPCPHRLCHGDLHHFNILRHGADWVVIDPKGVWMEPAAEVYAFLHNPLGRLPGPDGQLDRLRRFAEVLGEPIERLWAWGFVLNVLSDIWDEDGPVKQSASQTVEDLWAIRNDL